VISGETMSRRRRLERSRDDVVVVAVAAWAMACSRRSSALDRVKKSKFKFRLGTYLNISLGSG
jgi:hypothetical protein